LPCENKCHGPGITERLVTWLDLEISQQETEMAVIFDIERHLLNK
jgi:hypothetical protein